MTDRQDRLNALARARMQAMIGLQAVLVAEQATPETDWHRFLRSLDGIYISQGGALAQALFMTKPQPELGGLSPAQVLAQPGGFDRVDAFARQWLDARNAASRRRLRQQRRLGS